MGGKTKQKKGADDFSPAGGKEVEDVGLTLGRRSLTATLSNPPHHCFPPKTLKLPRRLLI